MILEPTRPGGIVAHIGANENGGRDFVVGDLHGCYDQFLAALVAIKFNIFKDRVFSVGDLIDRGKQNVQCLNLIYEPWFFSVRANHEDLMIQAMIDDNRSAVSCWYGNGGSWVTAESEDEMYGIALDLARLPYIIAVGEGEKRFNVVHAEIRLNDEGYRAIPVTDKLIDEHDWTERDREGLVWGRTLIYMDDSKIHKTHYHHPTEMSITFCGHTPLPSAERVQKQIYLDTGLVFTASGYGKLTIAEPNAGLIHEWNKLTDELFTTALEDVHFSKS